jgi:hypothetical protein
MSLMHSNEAAGQFRRFADTFFESTRDARALSLAMETNLGEDWKRVCNPITHKTAQVAIDVIGNGDPTYLFSIYGSGRKIADEIVGGLDTAVEIAQRRGTNASEEFRKIAKKHGWSF